MIVFDDSKANEDIRTDVINLQKELIEILKANKAKNAQISEYVTQANEAGRPLELFIDDEIEANDQIIHILQSELFE